MDKKSSHINQDKYENISQMKKVSSNSKKSNKLNLHIYLISFKILVFIFIYLLLYNRDNNANNKNNSNKTMKHAILLLSSYGISYMNNILSQFNNDKRFDIYTFI